MTKIISIITALLKLAENVQKLLINKLNHSFVVIIFVTVTQSVFCIAFDL